MGFMEIFLGMFCMILKENFRNPKDFGSLNAFFIGLYKYPYAFVGDAYLTINN